MISSLFSFFGILPLFMLYLWDDIPQLSSIEPLARFSSASITYCTLFFFFGFALNGPKTVVTLAVQHLVKKDFRGSVSGICGIVGQVGAILSGYCLGLLIESQGWKTYLFSLLMSMILLTLLLFISLMYR